MDTVPLFIAIVVLLLLSAFFTAAETAYSRANKIRLKSMEAEGKKHGKPVRAFAEEKFERLKMAILIGDAVADLVAACLATAAFERLIGGAGGVAVAAVLSVVAVLLLGEVTPRCIASAHPERTCFRIWPVLRVFYWIFTPLRLLFDGYAKLLSKAFKTEKEDAVTEEELRSIVDEAEEDGTLKEDESELVRSALEFDDLKVEDILVPRVDVVAVREDSPMEEILSVFRENRYSRLPVYREKIDDVVGLIHERDFYDAYLKGEKTIAHAVQNIVFTTEYARISTLLKQLQREKIHMAAVLDEYGGLVGIVTLEDILEELVGELWDEHDKEEVLFGKIADGEYWVDGKCDLGEFFALYGLEEEDADSDSNTVGGWVTEQYGGIPPVGEIVRYKFLEIKVVKAARQKVLKVLSRRVEAPDGEEEAERSE